MVASRSPCGSHSASASPRGLAAPGLPPAIACRQPAVARRPPKPAPRGCPGLLLRTPPHRCARVRSSPFSADRNRFRSRRLSTCTAHAMNAWLFRPAVHRGIASAPDAFSAPFAVAIGAVDLPDRLRVAARDRSLASPLSPCDAQPGWAASCFSRTALRLSGTAIAGNDRCSGAFGRHARSKSLPIRLPSPPLARRSARRELRPSCDAEVLSCFPLFLAERRLHIRRRALPCPVPRMRWASLPTVSALVLRMTFENRFPASSASSGHVPKRVAVGRSSRLTVSRSLSPRLAFAAPACRSRFGISLRLRASRSCVSAVCLAARGKPACGGPGNILCCLERDA